jgi:hypothetical protein
VNAAAEPSVAPDRRPVSWLHGSKSLGGRRVNSLFGGGGLHGVSAFLDNFQPDHELNGFRQFWRTSKPLLQKMVVAVAPPYPEYPKLKVSKKLGPSGDPGCPSARDVSSEIEVTMYNAGGNGFGDIQERAWLFILAHASDIEAALRRKLFAWHGKRLAQHCDEDLPHVPALQKYWKVVQQQVQLQEPSAVDQLFKLVGIGLADRGLDECGFSSFEFQTGWDRDHGLGVVMHRDRVLALGGTTELIGSRGIVDAIRHVQTYDLDDGDFPL